MERLLTHVTLATALVLCFESRSIVMPLAAEQGSANGQPFQTLQAEISEIQQILDTPPENATVSFGAWQSKPDEYDRFKDPTNRNRNDHVQLPKEAVIKAGGSVNFVISGFHQ